MSIETLLIANRGEIACRIIRTCRRMGIRSVAVHSEIDAGAKHVREADESHCIGAAPASESYLVAERILEVAERAGADAIHPGYGFLAENAGFAQMCADRGVIFVGPPPDVIRSMAEKDVAKGIMREAGVPVVPGVSEAEAEGGDLQQSADRIGYPVLVKAVAGGGGRGMRAVATAKDFERALAGARREAKASFGDDRVLLEKLLSPSRHVEVQVFADSDGNAVHLFERDCSIQRRHQKIVEEAPAPGLSAALRTAMGDAAVRAAKAIGYRGAGTVEFLLDLGDSSGAATGDWPFYFIEMNTRLQVEHPVTEMITGVDLVEWQLREAAGEPLPMGQEEIEPRGHSIETRICAENCEAGFLPAAGPILYFGAPESDAALRLERGVETGGEVSVYYDSMIAKLVVWGEDRANALQRLRRALADTQIAGVPTNAPMLARIAAHEEFCAGAVDSDFIDRHRASLVEGAHFDRDRVLALACAETLLARRAAPRRDGPASDPHSPWGAADGWRLNQSAEEKLEFEHRGEELAARVRSTGEGGFSLALPSGVLELSGRTLAWRLLERHGAHLHHFELDLAGELRRHTAVQHDDTVTIFDDAASVCLESRDLRSADADVREAVGAVTTPIPGRVTAVNVSEGDRVEKGEVLLVLEAMKMEHNVCAAVAAVVEKLNVAVGDQVEDGATLLVLA